MPKVTQLVKGRAGLFTTALRGARVQEEKKIPLLTLGLVTECPSLEVTIVTGPCSFQGQRVHTEAPVCFPTYLLFSHVCAQRLPCTDLAVI